MNATFPQSGGRVVAFNSYPTYNLINNNGNNAVFYNMLVEVTRKVTETGLQHFRNDIVQFKKTNVYSGKNGKKSEPEYLLEILMIGVLWNKYNGRWRWYNSLVNPVFKALISLRKTFLKKPADRVRGRLNTLLLAKQSREGFPFDHENFNNLLVWLSSTGEYRLQTKLLSKWLYFLYTGINRDSYEFLAEASAYGRWFEEYTQKHLGNYTDKVSSFLNNQPVKYKGREDIFFTGCQQVEYHLNMVGGEILNNAMRRGFLKTRRKVLLLPACMVLNNRCKAKKGNIGLICQKCSSDCNVSKIVDEMKKQGVETVLFEHTSDYLKWLKPFKNRKDTGLIGTACVPNLLSGGYALKRMNIPVQCIYLNYSGCSRHWSKSDMPTTIGLSKLKRLVDAEFIDDNRAEVLEKVDVKAETTVA